MPCQRSKTTIGCGSVRPFRRVHVYYHPRCWHTQRRRRRRRRCRRRRETHHCRRRQISPRSLIRCVFNYYITILTGRRIHRFLLDRPIGQNRNPNFPFSIISSLYSFPSSSLFLWNHYSYNMCMYIYVYIYAPDTCSSYLRRVFINTYINVTSKKKDFIIVSSLCYTLTHCVAV